MFDGKWVDFSEWLPSGDGKTNHMNEDVSPIENVFFSSQLCLVYQRVNFCLGTLGCLCPFLLGGGVICHKYHLYGLSSIHRENW